MKTFRILVAIFACLMATQAVGATFTTTISSPSSSPTNSSPITINIEFGVEVVELLASNIAITNGTFTGPTTSDNIIFTIVATPLTSNSVSILINAGACTAVAVPADTNEEGTFSILYDNIAPTASITYSDTDGYVKEGQVLTIAATFSEEMNDSPAPQIALSGAVPLSATNMTKTSATEYYYQYTVPAGNGEQTVVLSNGTDLAGNSITPEPTAGATFTIDNTAPSAPTISDISAGYFNTNQTFTVTGEASAFIEYSTNGGTNWFEYTGSVSLTVAANNEQTFNVTARQTDRADNTSANAATITVTIDKIAPSAPTITGITSGSYNSAQTFSISGEIGATIFYSINGGTNWTEYTGDVTLSSAETYNVTAYQVDLANNTSSNAPIITLIIDTSNPSASITYSDADGYVKQGQTLTITATFSKEMKDSPVPQIALTGAVPLAAANMTKTSTTEYYYQYTVPAGNGGQTVVLSNGTDLAGNPITPEPTSGATFTIDNIAPSAPTISGISTGYFNTNQSFTVTGEASAFIEYSTNGGTNWFEYTGSVSLSVAANNEQTFNVTARQTDRADNTSANAATITVTIDKIAPNAPTISGISSGAFNTNQTFSISGEAGATIQYSTNGGTNWSTYSSAVTLSAEGTYNVTARQTDQAGNLSVNATTINVTIDKTTLLPTLTAPASDSYINKDINVTFTLHENALSNSVIITFTRISGTADPGSPHVLRFNSSFEASGTYNTQLDGLNLVFHGNVSLISGSTSLEDGTVYDVELKYQDALGNPIQSAISTTVSYNNEGPSASFEPITPNPRNFSAGTVTLNFTKIVWYANVDYTDFRLTRNGTNIPLSNSLPITYTLEAGYVNSSREFFINLSGYDNDNGNYVLTLEATGSNIHDWYNNYLQDDASVSWTIDKTAPTLPFVNFVSNNTDPTYALKSNIVTLTFDSNEPISDVVVTINGVAVTATETGTPNRWTASKTITEDTPVGSTIPFTINFKDLANNSGTQVTNTTDGSSVTYYPSSPTLSSVSIASNNAYSSSYAKVGNEITLNFSSSSALKDVSVTFAGQPASTITSTPNEKDWSAKYTLSGVESEGVIVFQISYKDKAGNIGTPVASTTNSSSVTFDKTTPTLTNVTIQSNYIRPQNVGTGGILTLSITANEPINTPVVTFAGNPASSINFVGGFWQATYTMAGTETEGNVPFSIIATDLVGNTAAAVLTTTNGLYVTYDKTAPVISNVGISSDNVNNSDLAVIGDEITILFTSNEPIEGISVKANGKNMAISNISGNNWEATYAMASSNPQGIVTFTIDCFDYYGNPSITKSTTDNSSEVFFDKLKPILNPVSIVSNNALNTSKAIVGNLVTVTFEANEEITNVAATILGKAAMVTNTSGNIWTGEYTIASSDPEGIVTFAISCSDIAGNMANTVTQITTGSNVKVEKTKPFLNPVTIESNNALNNQYAITGNIVTLNFTSSKGIVITSATIADNAAVVNSNPQGLVWTASTTMLIGNPSGLIAFNIAFRDSAGNIGNAVTTTTNGSSVTFDKLSPTLTFVGIASTNQNTNRAKLGDIITVTFTSSEAIQTPSVSIFGRTATVENISGNQWKGFVTATAVDPENEVQFSIAFADIAGNNGVSVTNPTNSSAVYYDRTAPQLTYANIMSNHTNPNFARVGSTVSILVSPNDQLLSISAIINDVVVAPIYLGGSWIFRYIPSSNDTERTIPFTINFTDFAGNAGTPVTETTDASEVYFDKTRPNISSVSISTTDPFSPFVKTGSLAQVSFTTDEPTENPNVWINNNPASTYTGGPTSWVASRVLNAEPPTTVTFQIRTYDRAGNESLLISTTSDGTYLVFDNTPPVISSVTVPAGRYKTGDDIILTITADDDIYSDYSISVNSKTGLPFNNILYNKYTVTYTVEETDTNLPEGGTLPVSIQLIDFAGNVNVPVTSATVVGGTISIDTQKPAIQSISSNAESVGSLKINDEIVFTVIPVNPEIGLTVMPNTYNGGALNWSTTDGSIYTATYTVVEGHAEQLTPLQPSAFTLTDISGNVSAPMLYNGVSKIIYSIKPTVTITGTTTRCNYPGQTVPVTFTFTGHSPYTITYHNGTSNVGPLVITENVYTINVESGTYTLFGLTDATGNTQTNSIGTATITVYEPTTISLNITASPYFSTEDPDDLYQYVSPIGGTFSGNGVGANGYFYPSVVGVEGGSATSIITYTYTNANGCVSTSTYEIVISSGGGTISGVESSYCQYDEPDLVYGSNSNNIIGSFEVVGTPNGWDNLGNNVLRLTPTLMKAGTHVLYYRYTDGGVPFEIQRSFVVDSVGQNVDFVTLNDNYCVNSSNIQLNAVNLFPANGLGYFSGPVSGLTAIPGSTNVIFAPQFAPVDQLLEISFYYVSPLGCVSPTKKHEVTVNSLPVLNFTLKDNYNFDESPVTLVGNMSGGTFLGTGISNNILYPSLITPGPFTVSFTYTETETGCSNTIQKGSRVLKANEIINNLGSAYCYSNDVININCHPVIDPSVVGSFYSKKGSVTSTGNNTAAYSIADAGNGIDTVYYRYTIVDTDYEVFKRVVIDSIGLVSISGLMENYCQDGAQSTLIGVENHPQGTGNFTWNGNPLAFNNAGGIAVFYPTLQSPGTYQATFTYTSSIVNTCSAQFTQSVTVHALPLLSFTPPNYYNLDDMPLDLAPHVNPAGGSFSGLGVLSNTSLFYPQNAGIGQKTLTYAYTDENSCSNTTNANIIVIGADATIAGIPANSSTCINSEPFLLTGVPNNGSQGFFEGSGISNTEENKALFNPAVALSGTHQLTYRYISSDDNFTQLYVTFDITVIDLGSVQIFGFNESKSYCKNNQSVLLNATPSNGIFDGPGIILNRFYPTDANIGANVITYTFTSQGCTIIGSETVTVEPIPNVNFSVIQSCSNLLSDSVAFINTTTPPELVESWLWSFDGQSGATSTLFEPKHLYSSAGSKLVTLTAITSAGCSAKSESIITIGIKPDANFSWINECLTEEETVITSTSTGPTISNYKWEISDGTSISGIDYSSLSHTFPSTGFYSVKLTISSLDNCKDSIEKTINIQPIIKFAEIPNKTYYQNFEEGTGSWYARGIAEGSYYSWQLNEPTGNIITHAASGEGNAWYTSIDFTNQKVESSAVVSPCFDLGGLEKPMIKLNIWSSPEPGRDGAVIQYSLNQGITWQNLGAISKGINWYNSTTIQSRPGGQFSGWSSTPMNDWQSARLSLDNLKDVPNVRFRIAYAADGNALNDFDGFAFDDIWIGNRQQSVMLEYFTNTNISDENVNITAANFNMASIDTLYSSDVVPANYHTSTPSGDPVSALFPYSSSGREFFYGLSTIPYALANGTAPFNFASSDSPTFLNNNQNIIEVESLQDPKMLLGVNYTDGNEVEIVANVQSLIDIDSEDLLLFCAVVQPDVNVSTGETYYNVVREFLPNSAGINLQRSWVANESKSFTFTYNPSADEIANEPRIIVMVQNVATRKVYQSKSIDLTLTPKSVSTNSFISTNVFPNPAKHNVTVEGSEDIMTVSIIDLSGRTVSMTQVNGRQTTIPVEGLSKGVYFMQIDFKNERTVRKFVKE